MSTERVKAHFEAEAQEFDMIIQKLIPHYNEMIVALVSVIPFARESAFAMIDLGCGTGTVSKAVKDSFPNVAVTCVDIAEPMLQIAKKKIGGKVNCIQADFNRFVFPQKYDLIVSSLALHHLADDGAKLGFYQAIYAALNAGGMFINIDVVLGSDEKLQKVFMEKWRQFMAKSVAEEEITGKWLPNYYAEDRPAALMTHLAMLKECGFSAVDVIYKYYNYAVYGGKKQGQINNKEY
ncbi:MAG: methyltransferase domain-containing protein [Firmicutes bacterium]|nr:methyltransferase domain-containing protein [Bacillota bacterium]